MTKATIWILVLVGLLPATLLSVDYLISAIRFAQLQKDPTEEGGLSFVSDVSTTVGIGSRSIKLHLSTRPWPAVVVLAGVVAVVVGLFFLVPRQPDYVRREGFLKMERYVDRLLGSRKEHASIIVATLDGQHAILVMRQAGRTVLHVSADRTKNDGQEAKMRDFFKKRGMIPDRDYGSGNGGVDDATCNLDFQLAEDPKAVARMCVSVFTDLFGVTDQDGLEFTTDGL